MSNLYKIIDDIIEFKITKINEANCLKFTNDIVYKKEISSPGDVVWYRGLNINSERCLILFGNKY